MIVSHSWLGAPCQKGNFLKSIMINTFLNTLEDTSAGVKLFIYSSIIIAGLIILKTLKDYRNTSIIPVYDSSKGHHWSIVDILSKYVYCNICKGVIVDGMYCVLCGISADNKCHEKADTGIHCKLSSNDDLDKKHQWINGNLEDNSICYVCDNECSLEETLIDYRCCWCQRTVHESDKCFLKVKNEVCDLGNYKSFIIPAYSIKVKKIWFKGKTKMVVHSLTHKKPVENWTPLIVIANRKSGSNEGDKILKAFRYLLNPTQVIDLFDLPLENALEWCRLLNITHKDVRTRILIAGGDGTVGWVLNTIDELKLDPPPLIAILPLGTGNDLSRVLGWGSNYSDSIPITRFMDQMEKSEIVLLDRWKVKISPLRFGLYFSSSNFYMNNYLSIGVDALVTLNFHQTRESRFYRWLNNRLFNKFVYFSFGTKDILERRCHQLNEKITLEMDGVIKELPQLESIVILNIPSWAGGANIWNLGSGRDNRAPQKFDDKLIEVIGLYSSLHIGQMMIGLSEPYRFGQAKSVQIKLYEELPIQTDGEPWLQPPSLITIDFYKQCQMLSFKEKSEAY